MRALLALASALALTAAAPAPDFWSEPRHGANSFNLVPPDDGYFRALRATGATWVRLAPDKWKGERRDFLIGDADRYAGIPPRDLATLVAAIDRAGRAGLKVVMVPLSLPGARWSQNNGGAFDDRLWRDPAYAAQAAAFWRDLARALRGHPAVAAYNLLNEPAPERSRSDGYPEHAPAAVATAWGAAHAGTSRDLPAFYARVIAAIRSVDPDTPVMLDAGWYAAADGFNGWTRVPADPHLLLAVHMYEPWEVTSLPNTKRATPIPYPGPAPFGGGTQRWDRARVAAYLAEPVAWAAAHGIDRRHLVLAEFGCIRRLPFCPAYLDDVMSAADDDGLSWAFYSFREDAWDAMDYELGAGPPPPGYWDDPAHAKRGPNPVFAPIARRLAVDRARR